MPSSSSKRTMCVCVCVCVCLCAFGKWVHFKTLSKFNWPAVIHLRVRLHLHRLWPLFECYFIFCVCVEWLLLMMIWAKRMKNMPTTRVQAAALRHTVFSHFCSWKRGRHLSRCCSKVLLNACTMHGRPGNSSCAVIKHPRTTWIPFKAEGHKSLNI